MAQDKTSTASGGLKRSMGLSALIFYGTGTILGAGIFVVIGEVIGEAGVLAPLAYALAATVAITSALSFAELGARIPTAAGAIDYIEQGFGSRRLGSLTGYVLTIANIVSGATITTGFVAYLSSYMEVPDWAASTALVALLTAVAIAGMKETGWLMTATTVIGLVVLTVLIWVLRDGIVAAPGLMLEELSSFDAGAGTGLFAAAFLAVYSFIGFGDMAQTAEEVRDVKKTLPRAVIAALCIVFVFYIVVAMALVGSQDPEQLSDRDAPLVAAMTDRGWPALPLVLASLCVIVNGAITQIVAASRLLLDLGRDGRGAPAFLGRVNAHTNTPVMATLLTSAVVLALALFVPLKSLATATSFAILIVFLGANLSLWLHKRRGDQPEDVPDMPRAVPLLGALFCAVALAGQCWMIVSGA